MRRRTMIGGLLGTALFLGEKSVRAQSAPADVASSLAPTGRVRVAINYRNAVLAQRNPETGKLSGVSVDIAEELAPQQLRPAPLMLEPVRCRKSLGGQQLHLGCRFSAGVPNGHHGMRRTPVSPIQASWR